ncbi:hypothetical protein J1614_011750 [Plenodomus biglobosus]|nr:hypothetical protein J1614_011750 [Plenodomus biglobosus]
MQCSLESIRDSHQGTSDKRKDSRWDGRSTTMIQSSLDESQEVRLRKQKSRRRTTYYNMRPAKEKRKEQRQWAKRWTYDLGRLEGGEHTDWAEGSTGGEI